MKRKLLFFSCFFYMIFICKIKSQEIQKEDSITSQVSTDSVKLKSKEEANRNVMLNASNANGPRYISIGLPSEDVSVYENGLPVVYTSILQSVSTHWRDDASMKHVGLLNLSETAITTGNIAYAVNSFSNLGTEQFQGKFNYTTNHFGLQRFDLGVSGKIVKDWLYSASTYHNTDPGSFKLKFSDYSDKTELYKLGVTRLLGDKGRVSFQYKYSNSTRLDGVVALAPFIYKGDGGVKEVPGFSLGTDSYMFKSGQIEFLDLLSGEKISSSINNESKNDAHEFMLNFDYKFNNGIKWIFNAKYMKADNAYIYIGAPNIKEVINGVETGLENDPDAPVYYYEGTGDKFSGMKQNRIAYLHYGNSNTLLFTSELMKTIGNHNFRLGVNQWHYKVKYWSNTIRFDHEIAKYPRLLSHAETVNGAPVQRTFYAYNFGGSEFYDGYENKSAVYITDDWKVTDKLNIYWGGRLEYYVYKGKNLPYERYDNFHMGSVNPNLNSPQYGEVVQTSDFKGNYFNYSLTASGMYHLNEKLGITADFTVTTKRPKIEDYATPDLPSTKQTSIKLARGGIFYNNDWISLTSLVSYITKVNNITTVGITNPNPGSDEFKSTTFNYDIETLGWTTDAVIKPFNKFNLHFLFTYQKPQYKKFEATVNFTDGTIANINASKNTVTEIPEVIIEIDPSYALTPKINIWTSFRYFSKTYANLSNALYFNGRWETFGGVNYTLNNYWTLGVTAVNFLNQKGASGTISGAELITKEQAQSFKNTWMAGNYIRPFTIELSAKFKF